MEAVAAGRYLIRYCLYGWWVDPIKDYFNKDNTQTNNTNNNTNEQTNKDPNKK